MDINFTRLITNGEFGFLKIGQNKSEIENQNLVPECWLNNESKESSRIWRYGNFELHFDDKTHLTGIFNDYVDELDGGESLNVMDNWILKKGIHPTLDEVTNELTSKKLNFSKDTDSLGLITIKLNNGVYMIFENLNEGREISQGDYGMTVIGKK
ncbi:hypothetical protein D1815_02490 [Aquimarina sp. AD1]|uniref:hypothetical protein n=1 Tax=Aquimarina sp. (strain AD1) TaxID=1714848 RepID=UPI000E4D53C8|nr:hypothetical protein [Aquimarina sp. AD1]AXT54675.1 hypothetical protein D1815_02490 [Aquimarina sp. AD1]RKN19236.1 hypothetical protein D7035_13990 [Aquimarina sp. AD1]